MKRSLVAILISIPLVVLTWIAVAVNNFLLFNALIADDYIMPVCVLLILLVVVGLNPLLGALPGRWRLDRMQLALIFSITLIAAALTSSGFLRHSLYPLGWTVYGANGNMALADAYAKLSPPACLYPDTLQYEAPLPVIGPFIDQLGEGQSIPWKAWAGPLVAWSGFLVPWFLMMVATAVIFYGYWRDNERQPMPLLTAHQALIDLPDGGGRIPIVFRSRLFWVACAIVFLLHFLSQGARFWSGVVPGFPLSWNLSPCLTEMPWRSLPWGMKSGTLYFTFIGIAFFVPRRVSFSLWFGQLVYGIYIMLRVAYAPPMNYASVNDFRAAAFMTFPLLVLFLARHHLVRVAGTLVRRPKTVEERSYRIAAASLIAGMAGVFAWLMWVDVPPWWAAGLTTIAFLSSLALMRVLTETGLPLFFPGGEVVGSFLHLIPTAWRTLAGMYFSGILAVWFGPGQRVCVGAVAAQSLGMNRDHKPAQHLRLGALLMVVLLISLVGSGMANLTVAYRNATDVRGERIASWGSQQFGQAERLLMETVSGKPAEKPGDHLPALLLGSGLTTVCYALYQFSPYWPIHPVAMLCVGSWSVMQATPSIFLAWLFKCLVLKYGGARVHRKVAPLFLGLVLGEVLALIFWCLLAGYRGLTGLTYHGINILPH